MSCGQRVPKKRKHALAVVLLVSGAQPAKASAANVFNDFGCLISLAPIGGDLVGTSETHAVVTSSGNVQFKCTTDIPAGLEPELSNTR